MTTSNTSARMTKRDYFNILKESYPESAENYEAVIGFIDHEIELLERKNAAIRKPTAKQVENLSVKNDILEHMVPGEKYTVTDLLKSVPVLAEASNQKATALMRQLVLDGLVVKTEDKRKSYFSLAE